jgi:hypothetical protein
MTCSRLVVFVPVGTIAVVFFALVFAVFVIIATAIGTHAHAQVPPGKDRTVEWYADHTAVRSRIVAACNNDPGHGFGNPDCVNANMAGITLLEREMAKHDAGATDNSPPDSPQFWRARPEMIQMRLPWCQRIKDLPASWNAMQCGAMMAALR